LWFFAAAPSRVTRCTNGDDIWRTGVDSSTPNVTPIGAVVGEWESSPQNGNFLNKISKYKRVARPHPVLGFNEIYIDCGESRCGSRANIRGDSIKGSKISRV